MASIPNLEVLVIHVERGVHEVAVLAASAARDIVIGVDKATPAEAAAAVVDAYMAAARTLTGGDAVRSRAELESAIEQSNARFADRVKASGV